MISNLPQALPLVPSCTLDDAGLRDQRERYARLGSTVTGLERDPDAVTVHFDADLDLQLLEQALEIERECCPFFRFEFDGTRRRLQVTVEDPEQLPALEAIAYALGKPSGPAETEAAALSPSSDD